MIMRFAVLFEGGPLNGHLAEFQDNLVEGQYYTKAIPLNKKIDGANEFIYTSSGPITSEDLAELRQYPMTLYYEGPVEKKTEKKEVVKEAPKPNLEQQILVALGKPPNFLKIECRNLHDNQYRCNVWVKDPETGNKIAHSFLFKVEGNTISPPITRKYQ